MPSSRRICTSQQSSAIVEARDAATGDTSPAVQTGDMEDTSG